MNTSIIFATIFASAATASAAAESGRSKGAAPSAGKPVVETLRFDDAPVGKLPPGWVQGVTGDGKAQWTVVPSPEPPSRPNVLRQAGEGDFPWCVKEGTSLEDGFVEVRFKAVSGKEDQAAGIVWRFKNGKNYYVARANALENNVSIYHTTKGRRKTILYVEGKEAGFEVARDRWHSLRVEFKGPRARVFVDGGKVIDLEDRHIQGPGAVGLWTKADSVTLFDDFSYGKEAP